MAIQSLSGSGSGSDTGQVIYNFIPESGAEYNTPLSTENTIYQISAKFTDPQANGAISLELYANGNLSTAYKIITVGADRPFVFDGPINRIKIISNSAQTRNQTFSNYGVLTISKFAETVPARTALNNDGLGDIYVHVEAHNDWQTGSGYGWNDTRRWVGWSYNYNGTGVYRAGRANQQNVKWQYKPNDSQTWQTLQNFPSDIEFSGTDRLTRAEIYDTELYTYVIFRLNTTTGNQTVNNTVDNATSYSGTWNVYLARYTKSNNTWQMMGAYNITTYGDPSHTWGPQKFFIAQDSGGTSYLYSWQRERTSNSFFRYNLTSGARSQVANATNAWEDGAFIGTGLVGSTSLFFVSPTQTGVSGADSSVYDYQGYNPLTNTWTLISAPSRTGEGSLWHRGGVPFRYSPTEVAFIGRRTYTSNNTAPNNVDRFWGRRMWKYNITTAVWTDISADLGLFYPHMMRPSPSQLNNMRAFQPQSLDWNGRFFSWYGEESGMTTRGNYQYFNAKAPRRVQIIGATGRARGAMSVGSNSICAYGHMNNFNTHPFTWQAINTTTKQDQTIEGIMTGGWEVVYVDGSVKYGPSKFRVQNGIYDPTNKKYYLSGWQHASTKYVTTTTASRWEETSYVVDEKTGEYQEQNSDFINGTGSADRSEQTVYTSGLAYTPGAHFIRSFNDGEWVMQNIAGGSGGDGYRGMYYGLADYTWTADVQPTDTGQTRRKLAAPSGISTRDMQVVAWGTGPRNVLGIPEGTLFWDGRTLRQYSWKTATAPFTALQTGWRIVYTTPNPGPVYGTGCYYGAPNVWRDDKYAICPNVTADHYYVFDLENIYTREPKLIGSHSPIDTASTPQRVPASGTTISGNSDSYTSNKACVGGVEIIYGHHDHDGVRTFFNDNIYIVRDPLPSNSLTDDKNA
jgi:hypothetical protein